MTSEARTDARTAADELVTRAAERRAGPDRRRAGRVPVASRRGARSRTTVSSSSATTRSASCGPPSPARPRSPPSMGEMLMRCDQRGGGAGAGVHAARVRRRRSSTGSPRRRRSSQTGVNVVDDEPGHRSSCRAGTTDTTADWVTEGKPDHVDRRRRRHGDRDAPQARRRWRPARTKRSPTRNPSHLRGDRAPASSAVDGVDGRPGFYFGTGTPPQIRGLANMAGIQSVQVGGAPELDDFATAIELLLGRERDARSDRDGRRVRGATCSASRKLTSAATSR